MNLQKALSQGLKDGFGNNATYGDVVDDNGLEFKTVDKLLPGAVYSDRYANLKTTFGQEVVVAGDQTIFRIYAGRAIQELLDELGIDENGIIAILQRVIRDFSDKIRLYEPYTFTDGDWTYNYRVIDRDEAVGLVTGKETISYKGTVVFGHNFFIPIIEG